jgi:hypothetical protein
MEIITGDLLLATENFIVQQGCCTACRPHGLSKAIAEKFPHANPYKCRTPMKKGGNTANSETRDKPGTCKIMGNVVVLFGQYAMGKPGIYNSFDVPDSAKDRLQYFKSSLDDLATKIPLDTSLAFPYKIGCGLAGGKWLDYLQMIEEFHMKNPSLKIKIYKLEG